MPSANPSVRIPVLTAERREGGAGRVVVRTETGISGQLTRRTGAELVAGRAGVVSERLLAVRDARQTAILVVGVGFRVAVGVRFAGQCPVRVISLAHGAVLRIGGGGQALGGGVVDKVAGLGVGAARHAHCVRSAFALRRERR